MSFLEELKQGDVVRFRPGVSLMLFNGEYDIAGMKAIVDEFTPDASLSSCEAVWFRVLPTDGVPKMQEIVDGLNSCGPQGPLFSVDEDQPLVCLGGPNEWRAGIEWSVQILCAVCQDRWPTYDRKPDGRRLCKECGKRNPVVQRPASLTDGLSPNATAHFSRIVHAMQGAEAASGPEGNDYIKLMDAVVIEATARRDSHKNDWKTCAHCGERKSGAGDWQDDSAFGLPAMTPICPECSALPVWTVTAVEVGARAEPQAPRFFAAVIRWVRAQTSEQAVARLLMRSFEKAQPLVVSAVFKGAIDPLATGIQDE